MRMNSSIALGGVQPDITNVFARSDAAAQQRLDNERTMALRAMLMEQGPGIMAGEENALARLAQYDPQAALQVQQGRLGMDQTRLNMDLAQRQDARAQAAHGLDMQTGQMRLRIMNQEMANAVARQTAELSAAQREEARREAAQALVALNGAATPQDWDARAQQLGADQFIGMFDRRAEALAILQDTDDIIASLSEGPDQGYRRATPEEAAQYGAAGGQFGPDGRFYPINPPSGMSVEVGPDGSVRLAQGAGVTQERPGDPTNISAMVATIDGILQDPALDVSTGILSPLQNIPGTPQRRFGTRARQLEGQAFLRAYQSLRGSGQITEIEGIKATQAIGRLDTAQSADDYRQALGELREILVAAQSRPPGWAETQGGSLPPDPNSAPPMDFANMSRGDLLQVDTGQLSLEELDAWNRALDALEAR